MRLHVPERTLTTWIVLDVSPVDGVRHGEPAEVRRGRGRGARAGAAGGAPRRARRAGDLRRRRAPRLLPPRASKPGHGRGPHGAARRAWRPTARTSPPRSRTRSSSCARSRDQPGLVVVVSDFRDQQRLDRAARRAARAPLGAGRRGHAIRARRRCPPSATWRWSTPRPASASRSTRRASRSARASRDVEAERAASGGARAAPPAGRARGALHRGRLAARARAEAAMSFADPVFLLALLLVPLALGAHVARRPPREAPRRPLHGRARAEARGRRRAGVAPARAGRRWRSPRSRRWCLRSRSRSARSPCRWSARRSCS